MCKLYFQSLLSIVGMLSVLQECVACVLYVVARGVVAAWRGNRHVSQARMRAARPTDLPLLRARVARQRAAATGGDAMNENVF